MRCQIAAEQWVIIQAGLGLRIAEVLALRLVDVDFLRRTVHIEWQLSQDGKRRVPPKTPRSRRTCRYQVLWLRLSRRTLPSFSGLWQVLDSNKSGGFLVRGDTAQTAAD